MLKISCLTSLITAFIIFCSCSDKDETIGQWDDNIKLSAKTAEFSADADSVTITTEGVWWVVTGVMVNDEHFDVSEDINAESEYYSIKMDCFTVERRGGKTLYIKAEANPNAVKRVITVRLQSGNYFDAVTVTQAAK